MAKSKQLQLVEKIYDGLSGDKKGIEVFKALAQAAKIAPKIITEYERIMLMAKTTAPKPRKRRASRSESVDRDERF